MISPGEWTVFAAVALAHLLGVASPGPDFAMVVRQSLAYGRNAGVWTAAGIGSGIVFHVSYGLFGLSWLTQRYPQSLLVIGVAGALFLLWMGANALRAQPMPVEDESRIQAVPGGAARCFGIGLLTNVLNPKAALFFVALFTAVVSGPVSPALKLTIGIWIPLATFAWFSAVALVLGTAAVRRRLRRVAHWMDRGMGVVLIVLGLLTLASLLG